MNRVLKRAILVLAGILAAVVQSHAQVQQSINISLTVNNQSSGGIQKMRISNRDIINKMVGTNVPGGRLLLVMPYNPVPDSAANIGAKLRVVDRHGDIVAETTSDLFNIYQDPSSRTATRTIAYDSFSFAIDNFGAEIYGQGSWSKSAPGTGGQGSFHCNVAGVCVFIGITDGYQPCAGTISGGTPRPARD